MNRSEFLQGLKTALSGEVPPGDVQSNLNYYDDYIRTEVRKGRAEAEVMEELGDPRLIARTIIDTTPGAGDGAYEDSGSGVYQEDESQAEDPYGQESYRQTGHIHYYDLNKWYWKLLGIAIVALILYTVITVVSGLLSLLIPVLPVILVVAAVMWVLRKFGE